jgi:hypothetical protein
MKAQPTVTPEEWNAEREKLLVKEKEHMRAGDALAAARRRMPWLAVDKDYAFQGPNGPASFADLFEGRRQLLVYRVFYGQDITTYANPGEGRDHARPRGRAGPRHARDDRVGRSARRPYQRRAGVRRGARVLDGASRLLVELFGEERGGHARMALYPPALPTHAPLTAELLLEIDEVVRPHDSASN